MVKFKEPFNGISHLLGDLAAIVVTVLLVRAAVLRGGSKAAPSFLVYGLSMVLLYSSSAVYHLLDVSPRVHVMLRRLDHVSISILIAGTYTPMCLIALRGRVGTSLCWAVWGLAGAVILTDVFWLDAPRGLKAGLYVVLGWVAVWALIPLRHAIGWGGIAWMLAGGLAYSFGALLYAIKKPNPWPGVVGFHEIWHLFVLAGSAGFVVLVWRYVLPLVRVF
ncbi:MAG: hemolysin III family protein [Caldiserica bacterium]|nr:hemolysin III family protein [Caldisericota bacterium]